MRFAPTIKFTLLGCLAIGLAACSGTRETRYSGETVTTSPFEREVQYELTDEYFRQAPECVTILPMLDEEGNELSISRTVEDAFARHLHAKMNRVIGPDDRETLSRKLAFDLRDFSDRRTWKTNRNCYHFMTLQPLDDQGNYLFFWSRKAVGVEARITTDEYDEVLWRGRHIADRYNGGLPLTPLDAAVAIFEANSFAYDQDVHHSLADDLARRILGTLPALRDPANSY